MVDAGTTNTRLGWAGEDSPKAFYPSTIGYVDPNQGRMEIEEEEEPQKKMYVGTTAISFRRDFMELESPIVSGLGKFISLHSINNKVEKLNALLFVF